MNYHIRTIQLQFIFRWNINKKLHPIWFGALFVSTTTNPHIVIMDKDPVMTFRFQKSIDYPKICLRKLQMHNSSHKTKESTQRLEKLLDHLQQAWLRKWKMNMKESKLAQATYSPLKETDIPVKCLSYKTISSSSNWGNGRWKWINQH